MSQYSTNMYSELFQNLMSNLVVAKDFLQARLNPDLVPRIDWDTLKINKRSFVREQFRHAHSDIVYECKLDDELIYVYCLFNHQDPPVPFLPFRMLQYKMDLMEYHVKQGNKYLPIVISLHIHVSQERSSISYPYTVEESDDSDSAKVHIKLLDPPDLLN